MNAKTRSPRVASWAVLAAVCTMGGVLLAQVTQPAATGPTTGPTTGPASRGARGGRGGRGAGGGGGGGRGNAPSAESTRLRGAYPDERANNDLLYYHLDIRVDPVAKTIAGKNTIRFKMLKDGNRIQIDLRNTYKVDKIVLGSTELKYTRQFDSVFIDFPQTLKNGETYAIDFHYSGTPTPVGRFGSFTFATDPQGRPWIYTACEEEGPSMWWPCKDAWKDEVENMDISIACPSNLTNVSNGRFKGKTDLGDGYTRYDYHVSYPINAYCVSVNIGTYVHFGEVMPANPQLGSGELTMDYYVLPENLEQAKAQFVQAKGMIEAYTSWFGEYPFIRDGYKLIHVPYTGMEHQSAVTYGNGFRNGYVGRGDQRWDFIIIHESGHEWFANAVTAADRSDMWIHEGWTNYLETLYIEYHWGKADALRSVNQRKGGVQNRQPMITERGIYGTPPGDQYPKGALFLNTVRSVIDDDVVYKKLLKDMFQKFKYKNIMTEDINAFFNEQTGMNLTPIFNQYLRQAAIPVLELKFDDAKGTVDYRWNVEVKDFAMPIKVGKADAWQKITPKTEWQTMQTPLKRDDFQVATDLYYINVTKS